MRILLISERLAAEKLIELLGKIIIFWSKCLSSPAKPTDRNFF